MIIRNITDDELMKVADSIKEGKIVVFPTETVYAIGVNGLDEKAIKRLYKVKQRDMTKPINLIVSSLEMIEMVAKDITPLEYKIIKAFLPGPLTIILKKKDIVPNILTNNGDTVGIRMPLNDIALKLSKYSSLPIAAPSANISNRPSGTNIKSIYNDFYNNVDIYIDDGESELGVASTIVKVENNEIKILRQGIITLDDIKSRVGVQNEKK